MNEESIKRAREIIRAAGTTPQGWVDFPFIEAARTGWPETLDEVERLRAELEDAKDIITSRGVVIEELHYENELLRTVAVAAENYRAVVEAIDMGLRPGEVTNSYQVRHKELKDALKAWRGES